MKRAAVLVLAALVVGITIVTLVTRRGPASPNADAPTQVGGIPRTDSQPTITGRAASTTVDELNSNSLTARPNNIGMATWRKAEQMNDYLLSLNGPVEFHGQVVDQSNYPVSGAVVEITLSRNKGDFLKWLANPNRDKDYIPSEKESFSLSTDGDGRFSVTEKIGERLDIQSISKNAYLPRVHFDRFHGLEKGTFFYGRLAETNAPYRNANTPLILRLWKKNGAEPLIKNHLVVRLSDTGQPHRVNFILGEVNSATSRHFDLQATITGKPLPADPIRKFDTWTISIDVSNGGLVETSDSLAFLAPSDGYRQRFELRSDRVEDQEWFRSRKQRKYYLQSRSGRVYGLLVSEFDVHPINGARFTISALINPHSSRNLEPDPEKLITDPEEIRRLDLETSK